jgi:hypothetical protein
VRVSVSPLAGPLPEIRVLVPSSRGAGVYVVTRDENGFWACTCPGFSYSARDDRLCRHIDQVSSAGDVSLSLLLASWP